MKTLEVASVSNSPFQLVTEENPVQLTVKATAMPDRVPANAPVAVCPVALTGLVYVPLNVVPSKLVIVMVEPSSFCQTPSKLGPSDPFTIRYGLSVFRSSGMTLSLQEKRN